MEQEEDQEGMSNRETFWLIMLCFVIGFIATAIVFHFLGL